MPYPRHLYRSPGPHRRQGRTFDYIGAADAGEEALRIAEGWFLTFEDRWAAEDGVAPGAAAVALIEQEEALDEAIGGITPATRAELERKADELGIGYNRRTKDETLLERITEAVG